MPIPIDEVFAALIWSTLAILASQFAGISIMWWLGLPPRKLVVEIEEVQNTAVGAAFLIVSIAASLYIGVYFSDGYSEIPPEFGEATVWFITGLLASFGYLVIIFVAVHRLMGREYDESVYGYLRREIIEVQNAALVMFLGGLTLSPFIAMVFQIIS